jgi:hypothetical protein
MACAIGLSSRNFSRLASCKECFWSKTPSVDYFVTQNCVEYVLTIIDDWAGTSDAMPVAQA